MSIQSCDGCQSSEITVGSALVSISAECWAHFNLACSINFELYEIKTSALSDQ